MKIVLWVLAIVVFLVICAVGFGLYEQWKRMRDWNKQGRPGG